MRELDNFTGVLISLAGSEAMSMIFERLLYIYYNVLWYLVPFSTRFTF
jgi:hypothetical protein